MSIQAFHIVFIVSSIAMSAFVGAWGIVNYRSSGSTTNLAVGVLTLVLGAALVWYSTWFVKKLRAIKSL